MGDLITILLVLLDFQVYKMVMRARDNSEIAMLAVIDIFIWLLAIIGATSEVITIDTSIQSPLLPLTITHDDWGSALRLLTLKVRTRYIIS